MNCPNCKTVISPGQKFCPNCGTPINTYSDVYSNSASNAYSNSPDSFNASRNDTSAYPYDTNTPPYYAPNTPVQEPVGYGDSGETSYTNKEPKKKKVNKSIIIIIATVIILLALFAAFAFLILPNLGNKSDYKPVWYITDNNELFVVQKLGNKEAKKYLVSDDAVDRSVLFTKDKKQIIYGESKNDDDYEFNLMIRQIGSKKEAVKLDGGVEGIQGIVGKDTILYKKDDNLYRINKKGEKEKIVNDVNYCIVSEDEKALLVKFSNGKEKYSLNVYDTDNFKKKEIIKSSEIDELVYDDNFENFYYISKNSLYHVDASGTKTKVDNGNHAYDLYKCNNKFYFVVEDKSYTLGDFIKDDISGKSMSKPQPEDYDLDALYDAWYDTPSGSEEEDIAARKYNEAKEQYSKDLEEYEKYQDIEDIKEELNEEEVFTLNKLYLIDGTKSEIVLENVEDISSYVPNTDIDKDVYFGILAHTISFDDVKKINLSTILEDDFDSDEISDELGYESVIVNGKKTIKLDVKDNEKVASVIFDNSSSSFLVLVCEEDKDGEYSESATLYKLPDGSTDFSKAKKIADDVYYASGINGDIVYGTDLDDENSAFTLNIGKNKFDDVAGILYDESTGDIYFATDYNDDNDTFTLSKLNGSKLDKIADDICEDGVWFVDGKILIATDYDEDYDTYTLKCTNGKNSYEIESDILSNGGGYYVSGINYCYYHNYRY